MSIYNCIGDSIQRYGSAVKIEKNGEEISTRAFVEPLRYKNRIFLGGKLQPLGNNRTERYLYIGPAQYCLSENSSVIETADGKYTVKRRDTYRVDDRALYEWAILSPYGEKPEDDYEAY